ncbi:RNA polymerase sigma-I factor [Bacillus sp. FJAT-49732]|uniref:RNA polymerase sigma factor SigI n=1 Tax=Lederbergia citrisecunda TaxID=2833583 RepID=A0A942YP37_9BACI|nr:RNA polymerase sigma-I factor [Lederbergia citrisecunda]MBS4202355.1 RNA polymerase sigma-I factor [Lederbergia citrisecunda]
MLLSIIQGVFNNRADTELKELVLKAKKGDEKIMNELLIAYTPFMKKTASIVCKRFINEHDDEFSVALKGFYEAILQFNPDEKTSLKTFSHLIIKRRLIDYMRKESRRNEELLLLNDEDRETGADPQHYVFNEMSISSFLKEQQAAERREEIKEYSQVLKEFGLSFQELVISSPKHDDSRKIAFKIAQIISSTPDFYYYLIDKKRLPINELTSITNVSRKTIERHRKYIVAVTLLMNSNFVCLKEFIREELL